MTQKFVLFQVAMEKATRVVTKEEGAGRISTVGSWKS